ncbi:MAG: type II secretion system F family protein [bacterium JZ-2024 1]
MPRFAYTALDKSGKELRGYLRADDKEEVERKLHELELYPMEIEEAVIQPTKLGLFRRVPMRILIDFTSSLAAVVGVGMPLMQGFKAISGQLKHARFEQVLDEVSRAVAAGEPLHRALSYHPEVFEEYYVNLVRAGEEGGKLEMVLKDLASMLEKQEEIRSRIREAMIYPAFIITVLTVLIFIFLSFVLPKLFEVIRELNVPLPPLTVFLMGFSAFMKVSWWKIILLFIILVLLYRYAQRIPSLRYILDSFKLQLPVVGAVLWQTAIARTARYLSTFYRAGIALPQALDLTAKITGNAVIQNSILSVKEWILAGDLLSRALERNPIFPPMMAMMTRMGEETGRMDDMLDQVSDYYESESAKAIRRALTLLEPTIILTVAVFVGLSLASVILPIYSIYQYIK